MLNFGRVLLFLNKSSLQSTGWQPHQTRPGALKNSSRTWRRVRHQLGSPPCRMKGNSQGQNRSIPSWRNKMGVSENGGTPKSSILIGIPIINRPFWGTTIFGNTQLEKQRLVKLDHVTTIVVSPTNSLKPSKTKPDRNQVMQFNSWPNIDLPDPEGGHLRRH